MEKMKDKEQIFKAAKRERNTTHAGTFIWLSDDFSAENLQAKKYVAKYIQSNGRRKCTNKNTLCVKDLIWICWKGKTPPR